MKSEPVGTRARLVLLILLAILCSPAWAQKQPSQDLSSAIDIVEWMFQRPLTCVELQVLGGLDGWQDWAKRAQNLDSPSPSQREALLRQFKSDTKPFAVRACQLDQQARQEIAPGLQFQSSEAFAEWLLFMMAVIDGENNTQVLPGPHFRAAVQQTLIGVWPTLPEQAKARLTGFPAYWANMRKQWPKMAFTAKNGTIIAWQNNLANTLTDKDRLRLASACLQDLQDTMRGKPTPLALEISRERVEFAARRMRGQDRALSDELRRVAALARNEQAQVEANQQSAELLRRMDLPDVWYPNYPGFFDDRLFWGGWWNGFPYRW